MRPARPGSPPRPRAVRAGRVDASVEQRLAVRVGLGRALRQPLEELVGLGTEIVVGDDAVDEPPVQRLEGMDALAQHHHLRRAREPDPRRDEGGRAAIGDEADVHEREQEVGRLGGEHEVGRERERAADADCGTVDRGDHRLRHLADTGDDRVVALLQPGTQVGQPVRSLLARLREVGAGRERAAGAGDQDGADRLVGGEVLDRLAQVEPELQVPGVELVGAVEGDRRGAVSDREVDRFEVSHRAGTLVSDASRESMWASLVRAYLYAETDVLVSSV